MKANLTPFQSNPAAPTAKEEAERKRARTRDSTLNKTDGDDKY